MPRTGRNYVQLQEDCDNLILDALALCEHNVGPCDHLVDRYTSLNEQCVKLEADCLPMMHNLDHFIGNTVQQATQASPEISRLLEMLITEDGNL